MEYSGRELPNRLAKFRRLFNYSQKDVALRLQVHANKVSLWEAGKVYPSFGHVLMLSKLYRTLPQELYPEYNKLLCDRLAVREQELSRN